MQSRGTVTLNRTGPQSKAPTVQSIYRIYTVDTIKDYIYVYCSHQKPAYTVDIRYIDSRIRMS
jgi:urease alpha subunit